MSDITARLRRLERDFGTRTCTVCGDRGQQVVVSRREDEPVPEAHGCPSCGKTQLIQIIWADESLDGRIMVNPSTLTGQELTDLHCGNYRSDPEEKPMRLSARRIARLEHTHANVLNRCSTCGGYDPMNPALVITRDERPLEHCAECGLALTEEGQPLPPHYTRIVLPDGGEGI